MKCCKCGLDSDFINITIRDAKENITYCPNCLAKACYYGELNFEDNPALKCDVTGDYGAVEFVSDNEYYCLNSEAMLRFIAHNLKPREYLILAEKYGSDKYMIHDDFYTEDGIAIQPMELL